VKLLVIVLAQSLSGGAVAYNVEHRVLYQDSVLEQTGLLFGAEGSARLGPVVLGVHGMMGKLSGGSDSISPPRDVRTSGLTLHLRPIAWLELGGEAEARRFDADAGTTVWRLLGANLRARPPMGVPGLEGLLDASFFPSATVSPNDDLKGSVAMRVTVGASYSPPRAPVSLRLSYRFERFEFKNDGSAAAEDRLEQFRGVVVSAGLRLGGRRR
jgi:hypothetical protein